MSTALLATFRQDLGFGVYSEIHVSETPEGFRVHGFTRFGGSPNFIARDAGTFPTEREARAVAEREARLS